MIRNAVKISPEHLMTQGRKWYLPTSLQNGAALFVFVASWCGHCQRLSETLNEISREYPLTVFVMEDSDPYTSLVMRRLGVSGFPSIFKIRVGGELVPYTGPRTKEGLLSPPYY
jgi:thiol-disulfide isomerase/thioredoxin